MKLPQEDLENRRPVWDQLQWFFMDQDPADFLETAGRACAESPYSVSELEQILFDEVFPACDFNLWDMTGEWQGFDLDWLTEQILSQRQSGKRQPFWHRRYLRRWWCKLEPMIREFRASAAS